MNYLLIIIYFISSIFIFASFGLIINKKSKVFNEGRSIDTIFIGLSVFVILSFHLFFIFDLSKENIINIYLLILVLFCLLNFWYIKKNLKYFINLIVIFLVFFITFSIPALYYGEQFYVFRGNYWDHFNYLSSSMLFSKYNYNELRSIEIISNYYNFQNINSVIIYRPFVNFFQSLYLNSKYFDIFLVAHLFKIFLIFLNFLALISFLSIFKKFNLYQKIILSFIFSISFFSLYVFEIDALAHLGSISLFLLSIKYLYLLFDKNKKKNFLEGIYLSLFCASLFIIYPEIFCIFIIIAFTYLISKILIHKNKLNIKILLFSILFFLIFTIFSFELNYKFMLIQLNQALNPNVDWWGYFGAFIFGKKSLILDPDYVEIIKNTILNKSLIELLNQFYFDHIDKGYNYLLLNLIPSFFGLYYLTIDNTINNFKYISVTLIILLNIYILYILKNNIEYIIRKNINFIYLSIFLFLIIILYLLFNQNFWTIIKIYSYCLIFIYLFIAIDFKKEKFNYMILILLIIFPIYKFSFSNNGIGTYDAFPSIIDKNYKKNINWNLSKEKLDHCKSTFTSEKDYFINRYIEIKSIYYDKGFNASFSENTSENVCNVSIINKSFIVTSNK